MDKKKLYAWPLILLTKSGHLAKGLKLFKLLKFSKIALTLFSMLISVIVYAFRFSSAWFAFGFVLMIFIHEMGHVIALKIKGYRSSPPVFIPLLGAVIFIPKIDTADDEAYVGYGGPLLGGLAALLAFGLWASGIWRNNTLLLVSYTAAMVNLFNLIPIPPLDGGRVTRVVGGWFKWIGLALLTAFSFLVRDASLLLIWIIVLSETEMRGMFKFYTSVACVILMTALMALGYTSQPLGMCILDVVLGCGLIVLIWFQLKRTAKEPSPAPSELAVPAPLPIRLKWFGLYVALAAALVGLMIAHLPHLELLLKLKK